MLETPMYDASILIVSYNTRGLLRESLSSVLRETGNLRLQILVVDNASKDGSPEMIAEEFPEVTLLRSNNNVGFGAANNLALQQASGRYYVLLNSDAFLEAGALERAIEHMDETPECGLGGGRLIGKDGSWQPSARLFHSLYRDALVLTGLASKFPHSKIFGQFDRTWADVHQAAAIDWVPGAFSIIRPAALKKVGGFDPAFFLYYEEVDLCRRLRHEGYSIWYWPDIVVVHLGGESSRKEQTLELTAKASQVTLWRMRSTLLYYRKHHRVQAWGARWLETMFYRLGILRNLLSRTPVRRERRRQYRILIHLMNQAWRDTQGGRTSPARPW